MSKYMGRPSYICVHRLRDGRRTSQTGGTNPFLSLSHTLRKTKMGERHRSDSQIENIGIHAQIHTRRFSRRATNADFRD